MVRNKVKELIAVLTLSFVVPTQASLIDFGVLGSVNFGSASNYTFAATSSEFGERGSFNIGVEANIYGNVAATNSLILGSNASIHGNACSNFINQSPGAVITGDQGLNGNCSDILATLTTDINNVSKQAEALTGLDIGNISGSLTLNSLQSSVFLTDELFLESGEFLTLVGSKNDAMLINVSGLASIGSGAGIRLTGGILAHNIIFNFLENKTASNFIIGASELQGNFISASRSYQLGDGATLNGTRFLTTDSIEGNVQTVIGLADAPKVMIPEPSTLTIFTFGMLGLVFRRLKTSD